jgi:hypothetical protein
VIEIVDIVEKEACLGRGLALLSRADQGVQLCLCSAEGGVVERPGAARRLGPEAHQRGCGA